MAAAVKKTSAQKKKPASKAKLATKKTVAVKKQKVAPIPKGYRAITPYLVVNNGKKAIEFYKKAFNAKATMCMEQPDGKIGHAELTIGDSKVMLSDGCAQMKSFSPAHFGGSPVTIHLYVKDVDAVVKRAISAGAKLIRPVENQFYGDRTGGIEDPSGHQWYVATCVENLTAAQVRKRAAELHGKK